MLCKTCSWVKSSCTLMCMHVWIVVRALGMARRNSPRSVILSHSWAASFFSKTTLRLFMLMISVSWFAFEQGEEAVEKCGFISLLKAQCNVHYGFLFNHLSTRRTDQLSELVFFFFSSGHSADSRRKWSAHTARRFEQSGDAPRSPSTTASSDREDEDVICDVSDAKRGRPSSRMVARAGFIQMGPSSATLRL